MKLKFLTPMCMVALMMVLTFCVIAFAVSAYPEAQVIAQDANMPARPHKQSAQPLAAPAKDGKDIVDTAAAAGSFSTLAKALEVAGLVETLKGSGPFTVFAPTDEAFAKIPPDKLDALMQDKELLKKVLLAHVVSGKVMAKDVMGMKAAKTMDGSLLPIKASGEKVTIGNAGISQTDIAASNGIIHVIDAVILPGK